MTANGPVYHALAAGQRMAGAPWPGASGRDGNALRQTLQFLKDIGDMEIPLHTVADALSELRFHLALDDEHHVAEARAPCVKQGKIDDDVCPSGSTGSICLRPPKRLPMPSAIITSHGFCLPIFITSQYKAKIHLARIPVAS